MWLMHRHEMFQSPIWWGCELDDATSFSASAKFNRFQSPIWWGCELDDNGRADLILPLQSFNPRFGGVVSWMHREDGPPPAKTQVSIPDLVGL